ncbi:4Fe-4S binding protein [Sporomusa acidovorans]|uniref:Ion-translocating oxidoreductase complex subunit B n=1 Tax=Sporomusa acidovorans (strain ATCC 49682 / DSM 3132 / Mol) TaxID=1123286 RepID=A0ABZ3J2I0_SPOA4|nr:4Fe-4S binding protein [Sporomusa acidovorans]OZC23178.1 electron transport complex subunit RsxB [Sporomusa acidovorans DSM 3132]SDE96750.1 4Fe-4S binding domain-containing protein [Sporomusa acidovorans]
MLSKLEQITEACAKLDKRGIGLQEKRCLRKRHLHSSCRRCAAVCPHGAITCAEGVVLLAEKCTGCGACTAVCPSGALDVKLPSNKELRSLVALHVQNSGAVAFACEAYFKAHPAERRRAIAVQCIARCDESILVDAVLQGATHVSLLNVACADCMQNKLCGLVQTMADTANRLLACWKYASVIALTEKIPEKIKPLPVSEGEATGMSRRAFLTVFKRKSASLITQVLPEVIAGTADRRTESSKIPQNPMAETKYVPDKWRLLVDSLKQLQNMAGPTEFPNSLWGAISIAGSCNGCGACADACPTAALVIWKQDSLWSISVDTSRCTQCGLCQDICCCDSINITPTVALDAMLSQTPQVLIEKRQEEVDKLFEPLEQRMARLLGCVVKN